MRFIFNLETLLRTLFMIYKTGEITENEHKKQVKIIKDFFLVSERHCLLRKVEKKLNQTNHSNASH